MSTYAGRISKLRREIWAQCKHNTRKSHALWQRTWPLQMCMERGPYTLENIIKQWADFKAMPTISLENQKRLAHFQLNKKLHSVAAGKRIASFSLLPMRFSISFLPVRCWTTRFRRVTFVAKDRYTSERSCSLSKKVTTPRATYFGKPRNSCHCVPTPTHQKQCNPHLHTLWPNDSQPPKTCTSGFAGRGVPLSEKKGL